jgi:hypothetical protein
MLAHCATDACAGRPARLCQGLPDCTLQYQAASARLETTWRWRPAVLDAQDDARRLTPAVSQHDGRWARAGSSKKSPPTRLCRRAA